MQKQTQDSGSGAAMEAAEDSTTDIAVLASVASVALSWYQFFVRGDREMGLFVGLWAPTIIGFASYFNQKRMEQKLASLGPSRIKDSIEQMLSGR
nr:hypothetical protein [Halorussus marinus]